MRDHNRDWALRLAEAGIAIFPCGADKKPLIKWREFSSSDPEAIAQWRRQFPGALPAIDLEKCDLFVLDGDRHGGPDGRAALGKLLRQQIGFDWHTAPSAFTPGDGAHVYFLQNGHELGNGRGQLPDGVDARGCGGYVIAPYATLSDGRCYRTIAGTPDLISAYKAGTIPHVPQGIVDLIHASDRTPDQEQNFSSIAGAREQAYAQTALEGCMAELAGTSAGNRNEKLNAIAYRLGRMIARGWLDRTAVEGALLGAMFANGAVADDGLEAAKATLKSGIDAGMAEPHPDLTERDGKPQATEAPKAINPCTLADVHATFQKWFGKEYDIATLDAVLAVAAAEKLPGDPPWLLIISGPGNAKTETVGATSGLNARVVSTITSEGALLSASPRKNRAKTATGGLLRQIGEHGILTIKDFTSIISANRDTRTQVLAALREIYDGLWVRNVGSDGGQSLEWKGRLIVIGACTTVWDQAHGVVATMGDRFVLIRSDSSAGPSRIAAGTQAIRNAGTETAMRQELAGAVTGLIGQVAGNCAYELTQDEMDCILQAANIVTLARTGVEIDYRGDVIDAHMPEMPTRFAKQLTQIMRGALAIGMSRQEAKTLVIRCARDSMPPLRLAILEDIAANPDSRIIDVRRRLQRPRATADRALQALHVLGLLTCREEEEQREDGPRYIRHYSIPKGYSLGAISVPDLSVDNDFYK
jgi:Bifunctional DNA primase/polymerase, N-terminal